jgi:hypothetical protein
VNSELALQFIRDLRQPGSVASDQHEIVMVFGEQFSQFVSDTAGSAGDQRGGHVLIHNPPNRLVILSGLEE